MKHIKTDETVSAWKKSRRILLVLAEDHEDAIQFAKTTCEKTLQPKEHLIVIFRKPDPDYRQSDTNHTVIQFIKIEQEDIARTVAECAKHHTDTVLIENPDAEVFENIYNLYLSGVRTIITKQASSLEDGLNSFRKTLPEIENDPEFLIGAIFLPKNDPENQSETTLLA